MKGGGLLLTPCLHLMPMYKRAHAQESYIMRVCWSAHYVSSLLLLGTRQPSNLLTMTQVYCVPSGVDLGLDNIQIYNYPAGATVLHSAHVVLQQNSKAVCLLN